MYGLSTACIAIYSHLDLFLETSSINVKFEKRNDLNTVIK